MNITIGKLAALAGVNVETIRYYQRRGLMSVPATAGGDGAAVRRYGDEDWRRLQFIRSAHGAGFTLNEIGELLALEGAADKERVRALATQRIAALDSKIAEMMAARSALQRLATQCEASKANVDAPCPIISAFQQS